MTDPAALLVTLTVAELQDLFREVVASAPPRYYSQNDSPLGKRRHLELVKAGQLTGYQEGRKVLVKSDEVHAYIERQRAPGPRIVSRPPRGSKASPASSAELPPKARSRLAALTT